MRGEQSRAGKASNFNDALHKAHEVFQKHFGDDATQRQNEFLFHISELISLSTENLSTSGTIRDATKKELLRAVNATKRDSINALNKSGWSDAIRLPINKHNHPTHQAFTDLCTALNAELRRINNYLSQFNGTKSQPKPQPPAPSLVRKAQAGPPWLYVAAVLERLMQQKIIGKSRSAKAHVNYLIRLCVSYQPRHESNSAISAQIKLIIDDLHTATANTKSNFISSLHYKKNRASHWLQNLYKLQNEGSLTTVMDLPPDPFDTKHAISVLQRAMDAAASPPLQSHHLQNEKIAALQPDLSDFFEYYIPYLSLVDFTRTIKQYTSNFCKQGATRNTEADGTLATLIDEYLAHLNLAISKSNEDPIYHCEDIFRQWAVKKQSGQVILMRPVASSDATKADLACVTELLTMRQLRNLIRPVAPTQATEAASPSPSARAIQTQPKALSPMVTRASAKARRRRSKSKTYNENIEPNINQTPNQRHRHYESLGTTGTPPPRHLLSANNSAFLQKQCAHRKGMVAAAKGLLRVQSPSQPTHS